MAKKVAQKPEIRVMAADWSLRDYPTAGRPWSLETKVKKVKEAGFDGMSSGANAELAAELQKNGMELVGGVDVGSKKDADAKMKAFADVGTIHVNVQLCDHDTPTKDALKVARQVVKAGIKFNIKPAIEIHRDTCTETPEKAFALAKAYEKKYKKKLRMKFDHSHPAIIKQIRPTEYWARLSERTDLLQMHELIHFRPFTGSHCQTPVTDGKGRGRLDRDFKVWLDNYLEPVLAAWLKGVKSGKTLYAVPELGPQGSGYALACFPDIWKDAIREKDEILKVWR
ncbi:MAG: xylose isomerase, partial [Candidatus Latescibacteria bacterium]|nr:xylose isomerase [Candidatus Latescibacterota bacterium]